MAQRPDDIRWLRRVPGPVAELCTLPRLDYSDAVVAANAAVAMSAGEWVAAFHRNVPVWLRSLFDEPDELPGLIARGENWVLLEEAESLMTVQFVCLVAGDSATIGFFVAFRWRAARFIWPPVSLLHRRVAVTTMRRAAGSASSPDSPGIRQQQP